MRHRFPFGWIQVLFLGLAVVCFGRPQLQNVQWDEPIYLPSKVQPVREILKEISRQAEVCFVYADALIGDKTLAFPAQGIPLKDVMRQLLNAYQLGFQTLPPNIIALYKVTSPPRVIKRIEPEPEPIPFRPIPLVAPRLITQSQPPYPNAALNRGLEGPVSLNLLVNKLGKVDRVELVTTSGHTILDQAGMRFAKTLEFEPARQGEKPVDIWINHVLEFRLVQREQLPEIQAQFLFEKQTQLADPLLPDRSTVQDQYVDALIHFARIEGEWPVDRINTEVRRLVVSGIFEPWNTYTETHRLSFLLLHQYLQVHSPSKHDQTVLNQLVSCLHRLFEEEKVNPDTPERANHNRRFHQDALSFLSQNYPQSLLE